MKRFIAVILTISALSLGADAYADGPRGNTSWNNNHAAIHGNDFHGHDYHGGDFHGHDFHGYGHHSFFSFSFGVPLIWRPYAYYPYSYYPYPPTTVVVERQPEVYVQQPPPAPAPQTAPANYWYYCPDSRTYYPYVQTCPSNWLQVVPPTSP